ncbi:MAG TPA: peptidoglycan DD-metalloendopeptidase family protein [Conexibacter sp.]|jgi:murein DD-endopeptidase MepM/ murein hydrolase activator NlpD
MARSLRAFLLMTAFGAALAAPASALASNGGAAPTAVTAQSGGAAPGATTGHTRASSAQTGGAVPGHKPRQARAPGAPRKPTPKARRRAAHKPVAPPRRTSTPRRTSAPRRTSTPPETPPAPPSSDDGTSDTGTAAGVFPVRGPFTFGGPDGRFGVGRPGHIHAGQDVPADSGTPLVAPTAGTISWKANQPGGAGIYVVMHDPGSDRDYVFMHLKSGSVLVAPGDAVSAGQQLAEVGATGDATGPHLHFEIWVGGWQAEGGEPIDPLPQLERWAGS